MLELKAGISEARYAPNPLITFQIFFRTGPSQPDDKETTVTSEMTKSLFDTNFKTKLDWQLARAESLAG